MQQILPYLFFLACPISMGVMMWLMMRKDPTHASAPKADPRMAELESQVSELRMALHERQRSEPGASTATAANVTKK